MTFEPLRTYTLLDHAISPYGDIISSIWLCRNFQFSSEITESSPISPAAAQISPAPPSSIPPGQTEKNHSSQNMTRSSPQKIPSDRSAHNAAPFFRSRVSPTH